MFADATCRTVGNDLPVRLGTPYPFQHQSETSFFSRPIPPLLPYVRVPSSPVPIPAKTASLNGQEADSEGMYDTDTDDDSMPELQTVSNSGDDSDRDNSPAPSTDTATVVDAISKAVKIMDNDHAGSAVHIIDSPRYEPNYTQYMDELVTDTLMDASRSIDLLPTPSPGVVNDDFYAELDSEGTLQLRLPKVDSALLNLRKRFDFIPFAPDNPLKFTFAEAFLHTLYDRHNYLPQSIDRGTFVPAPAADSAVSWHNLPDEEMSESPSPLLEFPPSVPNFRRVPLNPNAREFHPRVVRIQDLFTNTPPRISVAVQTDIPQTPSPMESSPIKGRQTSLPNYHPNPPVDVSRTPPLSTENVQLLAQVPNLLQNIQYTRAWVSKNLGGRLRAWSSSQESLQGSIVDSDTSDIPPYDSTLKYPLLTNPARAIVASMKIISTEDQQDSSAPISSLRTPRGDDIPGPPSHRRTDDSDEDGSGSSAQTTSMDSVLFNDAPQFSAVSGVPVTDAMQEHTQNLVRLRKLLPINTVLRRPRRNLPIAAPTILAPTDPLPVISVQAPTDDGFVILSGPPSPTASLASTESLEQPTSSIDIDPSPLAGISEICVNPPEFWLLPNDTDNSGPVMPSATSMLVSARPISPAVPETPRREAEAVFTIQTRLANVTEGPFSFRTSAYPEHPSLGFWEKKMESLVEKRAAIKHSINRLVDELAYQKLTREDSPLSDSIPYQPRIFGTYTPRKMPCSSRRNRHSFITLPGYINSTTITISARPLTIYSVYGSHTTEEFVNSFSTEISMQASRQGIPYRLTILPGKVSDNRIRIYVDLPNVSNAHYHFIQFILRKFRNQYENKHYPDFVLRMVNNGMPTSPPPFRPYHERRRQQRVQRNQRRDAKRAGLPYHY
ncbi:hypothetical protein B0H10DRAFT_2432060 [Mycena sp. CBHHK59/15]|nr:hypothetical protein B0H10DRAFT_2432060 [Mycena sp. CBHHK59/15]